MDVCVCEKILTIHSFIHPSIEKSLNNMCSKNYHLEFRKKENEKMKMKTNDVYQNPKKIDR